MPVPVVDSLPLLICRLSSVGGWHRVRLQVMDDRFPNLKRFVDLLGRADRLEVHVAVCLGITVAAGAVLRQQRSDAVAKFRTPVLRDGQGRDRQ